MVPVLRHSRCYVDVDLEPHSTPPALTLSSTDPTLTVNLTASPPTLTVVEVENRRRVNSAARTTPVRAVRQRRRCTTLSVPSSSSKQFKPWPPLIAAETPSSPRRRNNHAAFRNQFVIVLTDSVHQLQPVSHRSPAPVRRIRCISSNICQWNVDLNTDGLYDVCRFKRVRQMARCRRHSNELSVQQL